MTPHKVAVQSLSVAAAGAHGRCCPMTGRDLNATRSSEDRPGKIYRLRSVNRYVDPCVLSQGSFSVRRVWCGSVSWPGSRRAVDDSYLTPVAPCHRRCLRSQPSQPPCSLPSHLRSARARCPARGARISPCRPARPAVDITGTGAAHGTRWGTSNDACGSGHARNRAREGSAQGGLGRVSSSRGPESRDIVRAPTLGQASR